VKGIAVQRDEMLSLVEWSICCEPGDEFAGMLRQAVGGISAIQLVKSGDPRYLIHALTEAEVIDLAVQRFGDPQKTASDAIERWLPRLKTSDTLKAVEMVETGRFQLIGPTSENWPHSLNDLGWGAPAALWVCGDAGSLNTLSRSIALVGSRTASAYGKEVTNEIVSGLADFGYAIVSGGAYGIDAIAHQASLSLDNPTIAVMAGGLDRLYPSGNERLLLEIADKWALIGEMPPGSSPTKWRFLQRNRLIAALGQATVVVEAGWRSGSINTANHATALGREVGAVPGLVTSPSSAGCHRLIRDGIAQLVGSSDEIREIVGENTALFVTEASTTGALEKRALDALTEGWQTLEKVASTAGLTHREATMALTSLKIDALAVSSLRGWRRRGSNL